MRLFLLLNIALALLDSAVAATQNVRSINSSSSDIHPSARQDRRVLATGEKQATESESRKAKGVTGKGKGTKGIKGGKGSKKDPKTAKVTKTNKGMKKQGSKDTQNMPPVSAPTMDLPNPISLGNIRSEGVTAGEGDIMYITALFFAGVSALNVITGELTEVVPNKGYFEQVALGLTYYEGYLFVAGGGRFFGVEGLMHVYDAETGEELAACAPKGGVPAGALNDVIIVGDLAYVTDSQQNKVMTLDVAAALNGECVVGSVLLPEIFVATDPSEFRANGIVGYADGLIIVNSAGGLYYLDLETGNTTIIASAEDASPAGDGLVLDGDTLYLTENGGRISVFDLTYDSDNRAVTAELFGFITSSLFDSPTTSVQYKDSIYSVNSRINSLASFPAEGEGDLNSFSEQFVVVATMKRDVVEV